MEMFGREKKIFYMDSPVLSVCELLVSLQNPAAFESCNYFSLELHLTYELHSPLCLLWLLPLK